MRCATCATPMAAGPAATPSVPADVWAAPPCATVDIRPAWEARVIRHHGGCTVSSYTTDSMITHRWIAGWRIWAIAATLLAIGGLTALTDRADARTTVSAAFAQTGPRTLRVDTMITAVPRRAWVVVETRRILPGTRGAPRRVERRLARSGRSSLVVPLPSGARAVTARVRVETRNTRVRTVRQRGVVRRVPRRVVRRVAAGRWTTMQVTRAARVAPTAAVRPAEVSDVVPPTAADAGSVRLSGGSARVAAGQVIALGITPATPDGLFVRVDEVARDGSGATATVVPARITDVVPSGVLDINIPISDVAYLDSSEATTEALVCSGDRSASATARAELSAGLTLSARWSGGNLFRGRLPQLTADLTGRVQARLDGAISLDGEAECTLRPHTLYPKPIRLAAFTAVVGGIPIPVVIDGQVTLTGSAEASGSLSTAVRARAVAEVGATYRGGRLTPRRSFDRSFRFDAPAVNGSGSAQVALSPTIGVRLAGAAGPEFDLTGGLKLTGDLNPAPGEPWWKLTAPVSLGARFAFALWGLEVETDRFELWREEVAVAQADPATGPPGSSIVDRGIAPEPLPEGVRTRLTWDSNTDVDLHTWNQDGDHAWYSDLDGIPGGNLDRDVIPGYGPETFFETDPSLGNQFTFGVCQFSGHHATVTVDVRDPGGVTRRFVVSLRGRKAAALLTTSPAGIEPYVDPGAAWCNRDGGDPTALGQVTTGSFEGL